MKWPREWCALITVAGQRPNTFCKRRMAASFDMDLSTAHLYYGDTELFTSEGKLIAEEEVPLKDGGVSTSLILDRTVMHPQGGKR